MSAHRIAHRRTALVIGASLLAALVLPGAAVGRASAQLPGAFPTAEVLAAPSPVPRTDGRRHLVYELVVANPTTAPARLTRLVVVDQRGRRLASFDRQAIGELLVPFAPVLDPGGNAVLRLDLALRERRRVPRALAQRLVFALERDAERPQRVRVRGAATAVERRAATRVRAPLRHPRLWNSIGHVPQTIDGRLSHAQRFAIDFVGLHAGGELFVGDPARNESYALYGADVLAVAPGAIVAVRDDQPDNTPMVEPPFTSWEEVAGNRVVQDLGAGRFALYAHLQPGSVGVAVGQRVQQGEVLGRVGNTGLSSGPHLHFQVMDGTGGPSGLDADGLPYVFDRFTLLGTIPDLAAPVLRPAPPPPERTDQLTRTGDLIAVP